jgi:hypothetical protein
MPRKNEPVGIGWTIAALIIFIGGALIALGVVGGAVYLGWDALCVGLDPHGKTAACRLID